MLSTLKSMNSHPTLQQRQGALHIADIAPKNVESLIRILEVNPSDPHFENDLAQLENYSEQARSFMEQGCSVSDLFDMFILCVRGSLYSEGSGITNRNLIAISDSKLAGFISATAVKTDSRWCKISTVGSYISKVGRSLMALIFQQELSKGSNFILEPLPDQIASKVMREGKLVSLPPLSRFYERLGARKYKGEGISDAADHNVMVLNEAKVRKLSQEWLGDLTIHQEPKSEPLNISGLYI
jgi:hypothetical protein